MRSSFAVETLQTASRYEYNERRYEALIEGGVGEKISTFCPMDSTVDQIA
jgi:hypothetical protein